MNNICGGVLRVHKIQPGGNWCISPGLSKGIKWYHIVEGIKQANYGLCLKVGSVPGDTFNWTRIAFSFITWKSLKGKQVEQQYNNVWNHTAVKIECIKKKNEFTFIRKYQEQVQISSLLESLGFTGNRYWTAEKQQNGSFFVHQRLPAESYRKCSWQKVCFHLIGNISWLMKSSSIN